MFKSILTASLALVGRAAALLRPDETEDWLRDPLSHPELRAMSMRELADIPFQTTRVRRDR